MIHLFTSIFFSFVFKSKVGSEAEILRAGEKIPFHWMDNQQPQLLRIALVPCPENPGFFLFCFVFSFDFLIYFNLDSFS